jgi:predicted nuclease of restriction endonuclease-like RecB superfamily
MGGILGIAIELIMAGLMAVTIGYCILLDRRLRAVRQDEQTMRKTVIDLSVATERAERAIDALKHTLGDCDRTLAERLKSAERYANDLEDQIRSGDEVLDRITRIVSTALDTPGVRNAADPVAAFSQHVMRQQPGMRAGSRIGQTAAAAQALAQAAQSRVSDPNRRDNVA